MSRLPVFSDRGAAAVCRQLAEGAHGPEQPLSVRRNLAALEQRGLATYSAEAGWSLTDAGRQLVADYEAVR